MWPTKEECVHASVVNGYDSARREAIFSESWAEFVRNRRMRIEVLQRLRSRTRGRALWNLETHHVPKAPPQRRATNAGAVRNGSQNPAVQKY